MEEERWPEMAKKAKEAKKEGEEPCCNYACSNVNIGNVE